MNRIFDSFPTWTIGLWLFALPFIAVASDIPDYGKDRSLPKPDLVQKTLKNGLQVWVAQRQGLPLVHFELAVRGGIAADAPDGRGLSEILASSLKSGTESRSARNIADELQQVGASLDTSSSRDAIYVRVNGLSVGSDKMLEILADLVMNSSFPEDEVKLNIDNRLQELKAEQSDAAFPADKIFGRKLFQDHPYQYIAPEQKSIANLTPNTLETSFRQRFQPGRSLLVVSGAIQAESILPLIEKTFANWKNSGQKVQETKSAPRDTRNEISLINRDNSVQSTVLVGRPLPDANSPDYHATQVTNTLFGGAFGSRLTMNIREDKGYTYSPRSRVSSWAQGGRLKINASVRNEVTAATLLEIFYELDRLGATLPEEEELQRAKRYLRGIYLLKNETNSALAGTLAQYWVNGLPPQALADYVPKVQAVTKDDVRRIGKSYFRSRDQAVVVSGDAEEVRESLALFGPVKDVTLKP